MSLITAADALAALNAAGHRAQRSPAGSRVGCKTLCYLVDGQYVNLTRLRQLAREVLSPKALAAEPPATAQVEIDPYKQGRWQRTGIGPDPVEVAERRAARWAERNPEHSYRVVLVPPTAERLARAKADVAPIAAPIAAAPKPVRLNATTEPAAKPTAAKPAALSALESLAAGGPLDCATWQALGWPFEGFLAWAQRPNADAMVERLRAAIRERGAAACLDSL
jgi:hypothetical protein